MNCVGRPPRLEVRRSTTCSPPTDRDPPAAPIPNSFVVCRRASASGPRGVDSASLTGPTPSPPPPSRPGLRMPGGRACWPQRSSRWGFVAVAVPIANWLAISGWSSGIWRSWWTLPVGVYLGREVLPQLQQQRFAFLNGAGDWIAWILPTAWLVRPFLRFLDGAPGRRCLRRFRWSSPA